MLNSLTIEVASCLKNLSDNQWLALFKNHPDPPELIQLMSDCGISDRGKSIELLNLVVKSNSEIIMVLPLFIGNYPLVTSVLPELSVDLKNVISSNINLVNKVLNIKVLGVGFIEGEYCQINLPREISKNALEEIWQEIFKILNSLLETKNLDLIAFKDFIDTNNLPQIVINDFEKFESLPYCELDITFNSLDEYFKTINYDFRRYLKHSIKKSSEVDIHIINNPTTNQIDKIYDLYVKAVEKASMSFGMHSKKYFYEICSRVDGAQYILFYKDGYLFGFDLVVKNIDTLVQKYIAFEDEIGKSTNIYFRAFIEKLNLCFEQNCSKLYLGASLEEVKMKFGCKTMPSSIYVRHKNKLINSLLARFKPLLEY